MEDVLEVYKLPYDAKRPLLCMDEMPKQLLAETREPLPCRAGKPARQDYEYKRRGVADLFIVFEPLQGKRFVEVTEKRRKVEWARFKTEINQDIVLNYAEEIIRHQFPYNIIVIDDRWQVHYGDIGFDPARFPRSQEHD